MEIGFLVRQYNKLKNMTNLLPLFAIYNFIVLAKWILKLKKCKQNNSINIVAKVICLKFSYKLKIRNKICLLVVKTFTNFFCRFIR